MRYFLAVWCNGKIGKFRAPGYAVYPYNSPDARDSMSVYWKSMGSTVMSLDAENGEEALRLLESVPANS